MKKLFLYRLYNYNKKLFFLFAAIAGFTLICNLAGFEITPFYVWGMYSEKEIAPKEYPVFRITVNGKLVDYSTGYFPANRFFLTSPLSYYASVKEDTDPALYFFQQKLNKKYSFFEPFIIMKVLNSKKEFDEFPSWYKRYLQQTTGEEVKSYKVDILETSYEKDNSIKIDSVYNLIDEK